MNWKFFDRILLTLVAIFLGVIAMRPLVTPQVVSAQVQTPHYYIEPRTTMLHAPAKDRHVMGKVFVDLDTGNIWGFPTITEAPYPIDTTKTTPPVSEPIYLGRYDLSATVVNK
jgi:hypothetical protein